MENLVLLVDCLEIACYRYQIDDNKKIILVFEKESKELYMNLGDMAEILGYPDEKTMLGSDTVLDILSAIKKETSRFPILDDCLASTSLLRKIPMK